MPSDAIGRAVLLPAGTSTLSKSPDYTNGIHRRIFAASAEGAHFVDQDGRRWLDMDMGLGAVVWGHGHPVILEAITSQARLGVCFSVPPLVEGALAEQLLMRLPPFTRVQFAKNGADVTGAAVRLARKITGRGPVLVTRYHGWQDWSALPHYGDGSTLGIPGDLQVRRTAETVEAVATALAEGPAAAGLLVCPEHWQGDDLAALRCLTAHHGALLVFDEVKAGLRFSRHGVYGALGTVPDLLCMGKGLANGMPLSALLGSHELMCHLPGTRFSFTHASEAISLAAALAGERLLAEMACWPPWATDASELMNKMARHLEMLGLSARMSVTGYPGCFYIEDRITGDDMPTLRRFLAERLGEAGIFTRGYFLPSAAHAAADLDFLWDRLCAALTVWAENSHAVSS